MHFYQGIIFPFVRFFFLSKFEIQSLPSSFLIKHPLSSCYQFDPSKKMHRWCTEKCKRTRKITAKTHSTIKIMVWRRWWAAAKRIHESWLWPSQMTNTSKKNSSHGATQLNKYDERSCSWDENFNLLVYGQSLAYRTLTIVFQLILWT